MATAAHLSWGLGPQPTRLASGDHPAAPPIGCLVGKRPGNDLKTRLAHVSSSSWPRLLSPHGPLCDKRLLPLRHVAPIVLGSQCNCFCSPPPRLPSFLPACNSSGRVTATAQARVTPSVPSGPWRPWSEAEGVCHPLSGTPAWPPPTHPSSLALPGPRPTASPSPAA